RPYRRVAAITASHFAVALFGLHFSNSFCLICNTNPSESRFASGLSGRAQQKINLEMDRRRGGRVRRRDFITLLGGAAAAWPLAARQHGERMRRIGVLMRLGAGDPEPKAFVRFRTHAVEIVGLIPVV